MKNMHLTPRDAKRREQEFTNFHPSSSSLLPYCFKIPPSPYPTLSLSLYLETYILLHITKGSRSMQYSRVLPPILLSSFTRIKGELAFIRIPPSRLHLLHRASPLIAWSMFLCPQFSLPTSSRPGCGMCILFAKRSHQWLAKPLSGRRGRRPLDG